MYNSVKTIVGLCSAANFINAADRVIMPTAIIQMSEQYGWNLHGQGWILSSYAIGYMASGVSRFYTVAYWISLHILLTMLQFV